MKAKVKKMLSQLSVGDEAVIQNIDNTILENTKLNLLEMGVFQGQRIKKIYCGVFSDPSIYSIQGRKVAFRNNLAKTIEVLKIK